MQCENNGDPTSLKIVQCEFGINLLKPASWRLKLLFPFIICCVCVCLIKSCFFAKKKIGCCEFKFWAGRYKQPVPFLFSFFYIHCFFLCVLLLHSPNPSKILKQFNIQSTYLNYTGCHTSLLSYHPC